MAPTRAAATSKKAVRAHEIAVAEALAEESQKPTKKMPRSRKKNPTKSAEPAVAEPIEPEPVGDDEEDASSVLIDWTTDLTWTLITAIESDEQTRDSLFPGIGAIKISGGKPKTHFYWKLAETCFDDHEKYQDAFAKASVASEKRAWSNKIKNRITVLVNKAKDNIKEMGETGAGISSEDEITPDTALTTKWDLMKADSPWFFNVRALIAARPNLQPVGLGNNDSEFDTSLLLPTTDGDTSSAPDNTLDYTIDVSSDSDEDLPPTAKPTKRTRVDSVDEEKPIGKKTKPQPSTSASSAVSSDSDEDLPPTVKTVKRKRADSVDKKKPIGKKTKPQPSTSAPTARAPPKKPVNAKDRFAATVLAEEETAQRVLSLKKEKNRSQKDVALAKIHVQGDIQLAKVKAKAAAKMQDNEGKMKLAQLKMEQEHQYRLAQLQAQAGPGPSSASFSGSAASSSQHGSPFDMYGELPMLPASSDDSSPGGLSYASF
ncbi:hypothetical protein B0H19DRAFT_1272073 [Mycena capillaripes]|nr:hypothetical protein B0H19DRAFT_1272073 [Mycena capillaripes]